MADRPTTSVFDGAFCRKPAQNFGGRRTSDNRDALLKKAKLDREKREKERLVSQSIVVVQASVRSFLARKRFQKLCREEYDKNKKSMYNEEEFSYQLKLWTHFYDPALDSTRLQEMSAWVLKNQAYVLDKCNNGDFAWIRRVLLFARYCIAALRNTLMVPSFTRYLRVVEVITKERSAVPSYFNIVLWLDLIVKGNFFTLWREVSESRQPGTYNAATATYMDILERSINVISQIKNYPDQILFSNGRLTPAKACDLIFASFVQAYGKHMFPDKDNSDSPLQVVAMEIIPKLSPIFPVMDFLNFLVFYEHERTLETDRSMLYMILLLSKSKSNIEPQMLTTVVIKYLDAIDKIYAPVPSYRTDYLYKFHVSSATFQDLYDLEEDLFEHSAHIRYLKEIHVIYHLLIEALGFQMPLVSLINPNTMEHWDSYCRMLSCLVSIDERTAEKIPSLAAVAFRKDILRLAYLKIVAEYNDTSMVLSPKLNHDEIVGFCWGFCHLLGAVHDDEFLTEIPMSIEELAKLIRAMVVIYEDIALKDNPDYDALANTVKKTILWTLRSLYDRNTRLQYVTEDTFKSQHAHIYLPLDNHGFDFDSCTSYRIPAFRRSTLYLTDPRDFSHERKLLQVLNEAPFFLTFGNRINVWHRLINNDKMNRDVPMNIRDHIQVRRAYLYEDAYEKLSFENVPDLRANIRISFAEESGIDGGGLLREFLIEVTKGGVDQNRGFFRLDPQNRIYPNSVVKSLDQNYKKHFYLTGRLIGKALYEQILLELPLAAFFVQSLISGYVPSAVDYLATLDPVLHRNLLNLRNQA